MINVSKIPGGTGIAGALFGLGTMWIFLCGVPITRYFLIAAVVMGCGVALILHFVRGETPGKPWILPVDQSNVRKTSPLQPTGSSGEVDRFDRRLRALTPA
jgi:hypothetical protein